jgi:nitrate reductase gamma subunit
MKDSPDTRFYHICEVWLILNIGLSIATLLVYPIYIIASMYCFMFGYNNWVADEFCMNTNSFNLICTKIVALMGLLIIISIIYMIKHDKQKQHRWYM